jgi:hypothetical protein
MVSNATLSNIYCSGQFYWERKPQYLEKTNDLSPVNDELYYIMLYRVYHKRDLNSQF